jgi:hypothetical protein
LMANPINPPSKAISVVRRAKINNATTNMTTPMSTSNSMRHNFSRKPDCLPANKGVDDELPLFTGLPLETVRKGSRVAAEAYILGPRST